MADETDSATVLLLYPPHPSSFSSAGGRKRVSFRIFWSRRTAHYSGGQLYNYIAELPKAFTWIGGINSIMLVYIALTLGERHSRLIHQGAAAEGLMCWLYLSGICALWYTRPRRRDHIKTSLYCCSCVVIPTIQSGRSYVIVIPLVTQKNCLVGCTNLMWFQITTLWRFIMLWCIMGKVLTLLRSLWCHGLAAWSVVRNNRLGVECEMDSRVSFIRWLMHLALLIFFQLHHL